MTDLLRLVAVLTAPEHDDAQDTLASQVVDLLASRSQERGGVQPPTPSWGSTLRIGTGYMQQAPWLSLYPGLSIFVTVLGINLLGDGLRDVLDPRGRG